MANARSICTAALRKLGSLSLGETPEEAVLDDCLPALNAMLESWSLEALNAYYWKQETHTLDGSQTYTIGSGGDIDTTRPTSIVSAYVTYQGQYDWPVEVIRDRERFDSIVDKSIIGQPYALYYQPSLPLGVISLWLVGNADYVLTITSQTQLESFSTLDATVELPPGYERAFIYNLAIEIAPEEEQDPSAAVVKVAIESKANIKRINRESPEMTYDVAIPAKGNNFNINTGY